MCVGSVRQWKHAIDPQHELPAFDRGEDVAGAPQQLLARQEVVGKAWPGQEDRPARIEICGSSGGTGPLDCPNSTIMPRGRRHARLFSNVVLPTES